jgi:hypothetical protein
MHNLHFIVLHANSGAEACERAESQMSNWGNDNNWRVFCGAVSEKNVVYQNGQGRFQPEENMTIEECNKWAFVWVNDLDEYHDVAQKKLRNGDTDLSTWEKWELYSLKSLAGHLYETCNKGGKEFNVLTDHLYDWSFHHEGVTQIDDYQHEGSERWVVFVDMHS